MGDITNKKNERKATSKGPLASDGAPNDAMDAYIEDLLKLNEEARLAKRASLNALEDAMIAKEALRINEERVRGLKDAFESVIHGGTLEHSLNILSQIALRETHGEARTAFYTANHESTHLNTIRGAGNMPESYANEIDGFPICVESLACGLAGPTNQPVITADVTKDPLWKDWMHIAQKFDYRGCWSFPIKSGTDKAMGTFAMYFRTPRHASQKDMDLGDIIAKAAAIILTSFTEAQTRSKVEKELYEAEVKYRSQLEAEVQHRAAEIMRLNQELKQLNVITANNYAEALRHVYINLESIVTTDARNLSNSSRANLRRAQAGIQKMKLLSNDINSYLELYDTEIKKETIYPNNILQAVLERLQKKIEEENAKITIEQLPSLIADPAMVSRLMTELIDNAIKFHKENTGPIINISSSTIDHVTHHHQMEKKPFVSISVSDNGIGFEKTETIFEPFTQLHDHGKHKGAGIGLAICKKIMEMHEGFIAAESEPGKGTSIYCYFPYKAGRE